jgi:hypothetical protein
MKNTRKLTGSPLWRQVIDKTPEKKTEKTVVINETEKKGSGKIDRKSLDRFDSHPKHHPDPLVREKYNKLFPAPETKKPIDDVVEESSLTNPKTP